MSKKSLLIFIAFVALLTVSTPRFVLAQNATSTLPVVERVCQEVPLPNLPGLPADPCSSPAAYIQYWFYFALYLAGVAALFTLVAGGVMYMISSTVPGASKGTKYITNAALGLILLFGSYILLRTLGGEQFITLKNPQLPSLPVCAIDFSPFPTKVDRRTKMTWDITKKGATKNAKDTTITCANSDYVNNLPQELSGELTFTPPNEGQTICTFAIHDENGSPLHECAATVNVLPETVITSCTLTKQGRYFSWTPRFDKEIWDGTFTCTANGPMSCSNSPCIVIDGPNEFGITFPSVPGEGTCTLNATKVSGQTVSCSTLWTP